MIAYGVYIHQDIEAVITEKFIMTFRRVKSQDALESCLLEKEAHSSQYACIGICRSLPATAIAYPIPKKWKYAFKAGKKKYTNHPPFAALIGKASPTIQQDEDQITLAFPDGDTYTACKTESFHMEDIDPQPLSICDENIGECLKAWHLGCYQEAIGSEKDAGVSVSINTKAHMYTFQMMPNFFYCRAARYNTCNLGVIFNQNFRQRYGGMTETYMVDDNRIAGNPLTIDPHTFGVCPLYNYDVLLKDDVTEREKSIFSYRYGINGFEKKTQGEVAHLLGISRSSVSRIQSKVLKTVHRVIPKPVDNNIYWNVASFTDGQIVLNGCQGDDYQWDKPS